MELEEGRFEGVGAVHREEERGDRKGLRRTFRVRLQVLWINRVGTKIS